MPQPSLRDTYRLDADTASHIRPVTRSYCDFRLHRCSRMARTCARSSSRTNGRAWMHRCPSLYAERNCLKCACKHAYSICKCVRVRAKMVLANSIRQNPNQKPNEQYVNCWTQRQKPSSNQIEKPKLHFQSNNAYSSERPVACNDSCTHSRWRSDCRCPCIRRTGTVDTCPTPFQRTSSRRCRCTVPAPLADRTELQQANSVDTLTRYGGGGRDCI